MPQLIQHNITAAEAVTYVHKATQPRNMGGLTPTGETWETRYTGTLAQMEELFNAQLATGGQYRQVSCSLTRTEGNMAELVVSSAAFVEPLDPEQPVAGDVGTSETNPTYSYDFAEVTEHILTHPKIVEQNYSPEMLSVMSYIVKGGDWGDWIYADDSGHQIHVTEYFSHNNVPQEILNLLFTPTYLATRTFLTVTYTVGAEAPVSALPEVETIQTPPGPLRTPPGRNWLYKGGSYQVSGDDVQLVQRYALSGPGGWDPNIYS